MSNENCPSCGKPKELYGCPRCDKPKFKKSITANLSECLRYLDFNGRPEISDRFWSFLCDDDVIENDSFIRLMKVEYYKEYNKDDDYDPEIEKDLVALWELFKEEGDCEILFEVSW